MSNIRKALIAAFGLLLMILSDFFGVSLPIGAEVLTDVVIALLTLFGVWAAPNTPSTTTV